MPDFSDKPTIRGSRVVLRPLVAEDAEDMWADLDDEEGKRLTGTREEFTRDQIERWCSTRADHDDRLDFAVVDLESGRWLGELVVNEWDPVARSCNFRIALSAAARNRGIGTEATGMVLDHLFDEIDDPPVNRVELEVYDFNPRARAVYEKVGFVVEGRRRQSLFWEGEFHDAIVMSVLRRDRDARTSSPSDSA